MKKVDIEKIKAELEKGFGKRPTRFGIEYSWYNARALDEGIRTRGRRAEKWRKRVLELAETGIVYKEKVMIGPNYSDNWKWQRKATAFIVNGEDKFFMARGLIYETKNYERKQNENR